MRGVMPRSTLSELSNLWEQRDVSDEEYVAALRERVEEKTKDEQKWYESFHRMMGERDVLRQRVEELEQTSGDLCDVCGWRTVIAGTCAKCAGERAEAKLAAWKRAESLPDCPACAALETEGE